MAQGLVVGRLVKKSAIKAVFENRTDRGDGASLDLDATSAGGIDARVVVAPGQRQDAEAGAKALLGMRPCSDDVLEKRRDGGTDPLAGCDQPSRRPFAVAAVGVRHMIGDGGMAAPVGRTGVARDPLPLVKDLDDLVGDADIDEFTDQAVRGGIPMAIDLDVIVGGRRGNASSAQKRMAGPAALPTWDDRSRRTVRRGWSRSRASGGR